MSRYYVGLESGLAMQKIAGDDRMRVGGIAHRRRSTPSAIIHVIVDNLFRGNRGECTAHVGSVAGNLVNIHVRIKPLAPVSVNGSKGNGEERTRGRDEGARWTRRRQNLVSDVWPRSIILSLLRHFRGNRVLSPAHPEDRASFPFFSSFFSLP